MKFSFHFLKVYGNLSQSYSLIIYFQTPSKLSISLRIELGLRSSTQRTMSVWAPQLPRVRMSSFIYAIRLPLVSLSWSLMNGTRDPYLISMFSLTARTVWLRSNLASITFIDEMLCSIANLMVVFSFKACIGFKLFQKNLNFLTNY